RGGNGLLMRLSVGARLVITPDGENCEVDAEADENGAETDADHTEPSKQELPSCECNQTRQEKTKCHAHERRKHSGKPGKENRAYQHDGAEQRRYNVVAHAQGNFRHKSRPPSDENLQSRIRFAIPSLDSGLTKLVHTVHHAMP